MRYELLLLRFAKHHAKPSMCINIAETVLDTLLDNIVVLQPANEVWCVSVSAAAPLLQSVNQD